MAPKLSVLVLCFLILACHNPKQGETVKAIINTQEVVEKDVTTQVTIDYLMGKYNPEEDERFILIPEEYTDRPGLLLRKEALADFEKMYEAATKEGIHLVIRSATRNFAYQKGIWERKWKGETILSDGTNVATDITAPLAKAKKILEYSSMPGTSRHHWGTDIDLNSFDNAWFATGEGLILYSWMVENAHKYGYCQPYTPKGPERPEGYEEEKWHWSYLPIAKKLTDAVESKVKEDMISGFLGSEQAKEIGVVDKYILGINKACR